MSDDLLVQISSTLSKAKTTEELARPLLVLLELVTDLESTYLTRVDTDGGKQHIVFSHNTRTMQIPEGLAVPWEGTLCKRALESGTLHTSDVAGLWGDCEAAAALGIQSYASSPVRFEDGTLFGTLCAASSERKPFTPRGEQVLRLFAELIALHVEREELLARVQKVNATLESLSYSDPLTGLPNRRAMTDAMAQMFARAALSSRQVAILFIDLDGFKGINDTHGHDAGDAFLVEVGRRLSDGLREGDALGRLGGDEFLAIAVGAAVGQEGAAVAHAMRDRLAPLIQGRFDLPGCSLHYPGASFGAISVDPACTTPEDALRAADAAMYAVKKARKGA